MNAYLGLTMVVFQMYFLSIFSNTVITHLQSPFLILYSMELRCRERKLIELSDIDRRSEMGPRLVCVQGPRSFFYIAL